VAAGPGSGEAPPPRADRTHATRATAAPLNAPAASLPSSGTRRRCPHRRHPPSRVIGRLTGGGAARVAQSKHPASAMHDVPMCVRQPTRRGSAGEAHERRSSASAGTTTRRGMPIGIVRFWRSTQLVETLSKSGLPRLSLTPIPRRSQGYDGALRSWPGSVFEDRDPPPQARLLSRFPPRACAVRGPNGASRRVATVRISASRARGRERRGWRIGVESRSLALRESDRRDEAEVLTGARPRRHAATARPGARRIESPPS